MSQNASSETVTDRRAADVGIVCSHHAEVQPLVKLLDRTKKYSDNGSVFRGGFIDEVIRVAIVEAGSGFARHRHAAETLIREHQPAWLLSVGFSSALIDDLSVGDVCLANDLCDTHGNTHSVTCKIPEGKRTFVRRHVITDVHPATAEIKKALADAHDAAAADTNSLAVSQACSEHSTDTHEVRFLSIRTIVDLASESVPAEAVEWLFAPTAQQAKPLGGLMGRFRKNPVLDPWKQRAAEVAPNLSRFTLGIVRQVAEKLGKSTY